MNRKCLLCGTVNRVPAEHLADTGKCGSCKRPLPPLDEPLDVDAEEFDAVLEGARVPVLVDFWAVWCGPCKYVAPDVARTAAEMAGRAVVLKVDTDRYPDVARRYGIRGIPTFLVFRSGVLVHQAVGVEPSAEMKRWLEEAARKDAERM